MPRVVPAVDGAPKISHVRCTQIGALVPPSPQYKRGRTARDNGTRSRTLSPNSYSLTYPSQLVDMIAPQQIPAPPPQTNRPPCLRAPRSHTVHHKMFIRTTYPPPPPPQSVRTAVCVRTGAYHCETFFMAALSLATLPTLPSPAAHACRKISDRYFVAAVFSRIRNGASSLHRYPSIDLRQYQRGVFRPGPARAKRSQSTVAFGRRSRDRSSREGPPCGAK